MTAGTGAGAGVVTGAALGRRPPSAGVAAAGALLTGADVCAGAPGPSVETGAGAANTAGASSATVSRVNRALNYSTGGMKELMERMDEKRGITPPGEDEE